MNVHAEERELSPETLVSKASTLDSSVLLSPYSARSWYAPCNLDTNTSNVKFLVLPFQNILSNTFLASVLILDPADMTSPLEMRGKGDISLPTILISRKAFYD